MNFSFHHFWLIHSKSNTVENKLRFPGQYAEEVLNNSSLYYNWHRWYGTKIGRYYEIDICNRIKETNNYLYVSSNPIINFDYLGLYEISDSCKKYPFNYELIKKAVEDVSSKIKSKCVKSQELKDKLSRIFNKMKIRCDPCLPYCGQTKIFFTNTIKLGVASMNYSNCGPLSSTILHEMVHQAWHFFEKVPKACEASCYGYKEKGVNPEDCK
jgi:RHS repeat-associated protein